MNPLTMLTPSNGIAIVLAMPSALFRVVYLVIYRWIVGGWLLGRGG